jgi:hypothetical protein
MNLPRLYGLHSIVVLFVLKGVLCVCVFTFHSMNFPFLFILPFVWLLGIPLCRYSNSTHVRSLLEFVVLALLTETKQKFHLHSESLLAPIGTAGHSLTKQWCGLGGLLVCLLRWLGVYTPFIPSRTPCHTQRRDIFACKDGKRVGFFFLFFLFLRLCAM